jgi:hypothetical protein
MHDIGFRRTGWFARSDDVRLARRRVRDPVGGGPLICRGSVLSRHRSLSLLKGHVLRLRLAGLGCSALLVDCRQRAIAGSHTVVGSRCWRLTVLRRWGVGFRLLGSGPCGAAARDVRWQEQQRRNRSEQGLWRWRHLLRGGHGVIGGFLLHVLRNIDGRTCKLVRAIENGDRDDVVGRQVVIVGRTQRFYRCALHDERLRDSQADR